MQRPWKCKAVGQFSSRVGKARASSISVSNTMSLQLNIIGIVLTVIFAIDIKSIEAELL